MQHQSFRELDGLILDFSVSDGQGSFSCTQCEYSTAVKSNIGRHIEANHLGAYNIKIPCVFDGCHYTTNTRNAVRKHVKTTHFNRR